MKNQVIAFVVFVAVSLTACVPTKKFNELEDDFYALENDLEANKDKLKEKSDAFDQLKKEKQDLQDQYDDLAQKRAQLEDKYDKLEQSYNALEDKSSTELEEKSKENRKLLAKIEEKQEKLDEENRRLKKLKKDLDNRGKRIDELEAVIAEKENQMKKLKENISSALTDFEGKGLTVHQKNGKVYVSMENKLLFSTGSYTINKEGKEAVEQLSEVLGENPDINVLIEGHTDNVPFKGDGQMKNNWDLSTKRAISVVQILIEKDDVNPKNLTAAGRSRYVPVADNDTSEGKAKNRRIEVILTPELDKVAELLNADKDD